MREDKEDNNWLNDYSRLKEINPDNPFRVPEGFFTQSEERIIAEIKLGNFKENSSGLQVPENYFNDLNKNIHSRITLENLISTQSEGFTVPDAYFDNLDNSILKKIAVDKQKDTGILRQIFSRKLYRYAAAACLCIAVGTGFYFKQQQNGNVQRQLSGLADTDIENYLNLNTDIYDTMVLMENVSQDATFKVRTTELSNDELSEYLTTLN